MLVRGLASVPTHVVCGADPGSASAICDSGGDRAVFHAAVEGVVFNARDVLSWSEENVGSVGHCVWFA